jgi:3-hydroxyacyl-[acyl-carrier-protein] dehydratase
MRFVLIDAILELEPGRRIGASKTIPAKEELFRDHFPGFPAVPGVLLAEMMAQAAGKCLDAEGIHPGKAMLGQIRSATFRQWVKPDQEAIIHAEIVQNRSTCATADCFVVVDGRKVCSAELFFVFASYARFAPDYRDEILDAYREAHPPMGSAGLE